MLLGYTFCPLLLQKIKDQSLGIMSKGTIANKITAVWQSQGPVERTLPCMELDKESVERA